MTLDIVQFHIQNEYYVKIEPLNSVGCQAHFPVNILNNVPQITKVYMLNEDSIDLHIYINDELVTSTNIETEKIQARLVVIQDILLFANTLEITPALIIVEDDLMKMLDIGLTKEEREQEKELFVIFRDLVSSGVVTNGIDFVNGGF